MKFDEIDIHDPAHTAHIKLDRSRHVGVVFPPTEEGAHYAQDGLLFDAHGNLAVGAMNPESQAKLRKSIAKRHADAQAEKARREVYEQLGINERDLEDAETAKNVVAKLASGGAPEADDNFDVLAWARGDVKAQWFKVRAAAQAQFGMAFDDKQHLLERLVEENRIWADEIKV